MNKERIKHLLICYDNAERRLLKLKKKKISPFSKAKIDARIIAYSSIYVGLAYSLIELDEYIKNNNF